MGSPRHHLGDPDDLTARARIRDAAMAQFGEIGFERTTIRGIAAAAGVYSGLVRHHFGSKEQLRTACDRHLGRALAALSDAALADDTLAGLDHLAATRAAIGRHEQYLARSLTEGSSEELFDAMVAATEPWIESADASCSISPGVSVRDRATVVTAMALAVPILRTHISRNLSAPLNTSTGDRLLAQVLIEIYANPMLTPAEAESALAGLDHSQQSTPRQEIAP